MVLAFLTHWLRRPRQRPDLQFVLYTRAGCCLCDQAWDLLQRSQRRYGFLLSTEDVDRSAELTREFGACVPVVAINGRVRFRGQVNEVLLRRILQFEPLCTQAEAE